MPSHTRSSPTPPLRRWSVPSSLLCNVKDAETDGERPSYQDRLMSTLTVGPHHGDLSSSGDPLPSPQPLRKALVTRTGKGTTSGPPEEWGPTRGVGSTTKSCPMGTRGGRGAVFVGTVSTYEGRIDSPGRTLTERVEGSDLPQIVPYPPPPTRLPLLVLHSSPRVVRSRGLWVLDPRDGLGGYESHGDPFSPLRSPVPVLPTRGTEGSGPVLRQRFWTCRDSGRSRNHCLLSSTVTLPRGPGAHPVPVGPTNPSAAVREVHNVNPYTHSLP